MEAKIGNLKLKNRIFLAPMAGINDIAFRLLCKKAGAGLTYTGMINPLSKQELELDDFPAIQLFSKSEIGIRQFIRKHDKKASLWDFNLGCPSDTARNHGLGYFLQDLKTIEKILRIMRESTEKPITIKLRISSKTEEIIRIAEKYCDAICIHPRTQKQGYSGIPDLNYAEKIKQKTKLPVIYSGNVNEENCQELLKKFDFVMIGRAALGNPNIFARLTGNNCKFDFSDYLKLAKKYKISFQQIKLQAMNFTKGRDDAKELRRNLISVKNLDEIKTIFN